MGFGDTVQHECDGWVMDILTRHECDGWVLEILSSMSVMDGLWIY